MPRLQDTVPSHPCRTWKRRPNPLLLSPLHFTPEFTPRQSEGVVVIRVLLCPSASSVRIHRMLKRLRESLRALNTLLGIDGLQCRQEKEQPPMPAKRIDTTKWSCRNRYSPTSKRGKTKRDITPGPLEV